MFLCCTVVMQGCADTCLFWSVLENRSKKLNVALGCCSTRLNHLQSKPIRGWNMTADVCLTPNFSTYIWIYFSAVREKSPFPQMLCEKAFLHSRRRFFLFPYLGVQSSHQESGLTVSVCFRPCEFFSSSKTIIFDRRTSCLLICL